MTDAIAPLREAPLRMPLLLTQALKGERVTVYDRDDEGFAWGQLASDGYVGCLAEPRWSRRAPRRRTRSPRCGRFAFPGPSIKLPPTETPPLGSRSRDRARRRRVRGAREGWYLPRRHVGRLDVIEQDFVAVAERFAGTPYLWGGKSTLGIDCSGLVQVSLNAAGTGCPRDSDMQQGGLGRALNPAEMKKLQRGDLIFWKGHVAIVRDADTIVHANAHHMATVMETRRSDCADQGVGQRSEGDQAAIAP